MGKLSQKYVSNEAVDKFFILFDYYIIINLLYFDASVNNLNKKEYVLYVSHLGLHYLWEKEKEKWKEKQQKNCQL